MSSDVFKRDESVAGAAGSQLVLRLTLTSADAAALAAAVEAWLARCARDAGTDVPHAPGLDSRTGRGFSLDIFRLPHRMLATVVRHDRDLTTARRWTSEISLYGPDLDLRLSVDEPAGRPSAPRRTGSFIERIVADGRHGIADVVPLGSVPRVVDGETVPQLIDLVDAPERRLPIVAISLPSPLDATSIARRLAGAAHVFCLEPEASRVLTDAVGRWHSVFHGGVRTYPPGFTWASTARQAPLSLAARLTEVREGLAWDERLVRAVMALASGTYRDRPFTTVREFERQERLVRDASASTIATVRSLGEELADLRAQRDALRAALDERTLLIRELSAENERLHREQRALKLAAGERGRA
jgi:hypothetical protein